MLSQFSSCSFYISSLQSHIFFIHNWIVCNFYWAFVFFPLFCFYLSLSLSFCLFVRVMSARDCLIFSDLSRSLPLFVLVGGSIKNHLYAWGSTHVFYVTCLVFLISSFKFLHFALFFPLFFSLRLLFAFFMHHHHHRHIFIPSTYTQTYTYAVHTKFLKQ